MASPNAHPGSTGPDDDADRVTGDGTGSPGPGDETPAAVHGAPAQDDGADGSEPLDVEAQWAGIVADLGELRDLGEASEAGAPGSRAEARAADASDREDPADPFGSVPVAPWVRGPGPRDWPTTPDVEALEEADSHFVPPDPPLVLGRDPLLTMAWALVVGAPLLILVLMVVARPFPVVAAQVGGAAFLAGLGVLLWRMPHDRGDDDDPGAVV